MSDSEQSDRTQTSSSFLELSRAQLITLSVTLVGLLLVCFFGTLILGTNRGWFSDETPSTDESNNPAAVSTPTDGSTSTTGGDGEGGADQGIDDLIVVSDGDNRLSIDLDPPTLLTVNGQTFDITAEFVPRTGAWPTTGRSDTAEWAFGSIINYVIALPEAGESQAILNTLTPGDRVSITSASGTVREFLMTGREQSSATNAELLAQARPQLTLMWQGDIQQAQRTVVFADYILPQDPVDEVSASAGVSLGESAQLGNARITVFDAGQLPEASSAPPGFSIYLVEFSMENLGDQPLDSGLFRLALIDELGNQYSLNTSASQEGESGVLTGFIDSNSLRNATAGYQIPSGLTSATLRWVVTRVDAPGTVEVALPFSGAPASSADVTVQLQQADISTDGTSLILTGQITNLGSGSLTVNEADLQLASGSSVFLISSVNPGLPFTVPPGASQPFALTYQRPTSAAATFTILDQSFELNGLR